MAQRKDIVIETTAMVICFHVAGLLSGLAVELGLTLDTPSNGVAGGVLGVAAFMFVLGGLGFVGRQKANYAAADFSMLSDEWLGFRVATILLPLGTGLTAAMVAMTVQVAKSSDSSSAVGFGVLTCLPLLATANWLKLQVDSGKELVDRVAGPVLAV